MMPIASPILQQKKAKHIFRKKDSYWLEAVPPVEFMFVVLVSRISSANYLPCLLMLLVFSSLNVKPVFYSILTCRTTVFRLTDWFLVINAQCQIISGTALIVYRRS